jgi:hypothetical protein
MKRIIITLLLSCVVFTAQAGDSYSQGWKQGWDAGWKQIHGEYSYPPFAPFPPFPRYGQDDYKSGFAAGVLAAARAAEGY